MSYGSVHSDVDGPGGKRKADPFVLQIVAVAIAVVIGGALASIELAIFRHGIGAKFGLLATITLVAGTTVIGLLAISFVRREDPQRAKAWTLMLGGSVLYFVIVSVLADQFYMRGAFAFGAPRTITAQREIDEARGRLMILASERRPAGYSADQRWAIAVNQSLIKAGETDLAYAKVVPESEQVYPRYPTGDEPGPNMKHLHDLVDRAEQARAKQGYPVSEPLPGYLPLPSTLEARIARAHALAAGAEAQVPLCKSGRAAGYANIRTQADVKACEKDWHDESLKHLDAVAYDQQILDFETKSIAKIAP
jgi:hypothetical protein